MKPRMVDNPRIRAEVRKILREFYVCRNGVYVAKVYDRTTKTWKEPAR